MSEERLYDREETERETVKEMGICTYIHIYIIATSCK